MKKRVKVGQHSFVLPGSVLARRIIGILLVLAGFLGFLPVLGFWMVPLGLLVLSVDSSIVRRWRRRTEVRLGGWLKPRYPRLARWLGFEARNNGGNGSTRARDPDQPV